MASSSTRRRRRAERSARSRPVGNSYRQNSYRAVDPVGTVKRAVRIRTRVSGAKRLKGASGWNEIHRMVDRLRRERRRRLSSEGRKAVRSISLVERSQPTRRNRGRGGPCIRRPNSRLAGEARQRGRGSGPKRTEQERLSRFRVWC